MSQKHRLLSGDFDYATNPLLSIPGPQAEYLRCYAKGLGARFFLLEDAYFDNDFLAEFSAYYSTSARSYRNLCKRVHFFSAGYSEALFHKALGGDVAAHQQLSAEYLGFSVLRPIPVTPIGRTVLKWFENRRTTARVTTPSRAYTVHVCGLPLEVVGLAWQQQDAAVAACATVGLWTILHSSAFDDSHFIPTTVEITRAAEGFGARPFPSPGLTLEQIQEAIKKLRLAPILSTGSLRDQAYGGAAFVKEEFANICSSFIRSGYPVLLGCDLLIKNASGQLESLGGHAVCAVGIREAERTGTGPLVIPQDSEVTTFYIHDDNIGPNVRFRLKDFAPDPSRPTFKIAALEREQPDYLRPEESDSSHRILIPRALVIAVHENFRISPSTVANQGRDLASLAFDLLNAAGMAPLIAYSARFFEVSDYLYNGVGATLAGKSDLLVKVRLALSQMEPMCLHIGVIRLSLNDMPLMDVILDTTDGDHRISTFAHIIYNPIIDNCFDAVDASRPGQESIRELCKLGEHIQAY